MHYQEFNKYFAKIMIEVDKLNQAFNFPITKRMDIFKNIKFSYLLISCLMQIAIVVLTTISANYLNLIINNSIGNSAFKNGLIITFVFFLIFLLNGFTKYILKLVCARGFKQCFNLLSHNMIESLRIRKQTFINKIDMNNFYLIDTSIQSISNFLTYEISFFCSNIFLAITTIIVIVCINPFFLIVVVASIISVLIIGFIQYNFKQKILSIAITNQNINNNICQNYIEYLTTQSNFLIQEKLNLGLKNNYEQFIKMYLKKTKFDACNSLVSEIIYSVIYFLVIVFSTFFIINNKNMNIGQLTLVIAILGMLHSSIDGMCDFIIKKIEFKTMSNIYENFVYIDKIECENNLIKIDNINSICLKNNDDIYEIENGNHVDDNLINAIKFNDVENANLLINGIDIKNINLQTIKEKIFCLNINTKIQPE
jgi:ABC-type bacteriocin/lantibiotic exporter with double-glycine peptidase domain